MVSWVLIRRFGPRLLILWSTGLCALAMFLIALVYTIPSLSTKNAGVALIVATSLFLFAFNLGLEGYAFLTAGELPAQNLRAYTQGLSIGVSFIAAWVCAFTAPYFINPTELNWGPKYAWIWFGSGLICFVFIYLTLPDVKGRSLEEIDEMYRSKVPTRKFKTYVCVETEQARLQGAVDTLAKDKAQLQEDQGCETRVENISIGEKQ
jgi:hypothetical protein